MANDYFLGWRHRLQELALHIITILALPRLVFLRSALAHKEFPYSLLPADPCNHCLSLVRFCPVQISVIRVNSVQTLFRCSPRLRASVVGLAPIAKPNILLTTPLRRSSSHTFQGQPLIDDWVNHDYQRDQAGNQSHQRHYLHSRQKLAYFLLAHSQHAEKYEHHHQRSYKANRIHRSPSKSSTPRHLRPNSNFRAFVIFSPATRGRFPCKFNNTKSFEILIFYSLDSNAPGALYCLRADTVFRLCMSRWPRKTICSRFAWVYLTSATGSRERYIGTGHCVSALFRTMVNEPWPDAGKHFKERSQ